jgi:hypothetical protein
VRRNVVKLALRETELSPRELFTDQERYFVSEASVYRALKVHDLITSPAFIVIKAANEFNDKTTAINQLWQTDFIYIKTLGAGVGSISAQFSSITAAISSRGNSAPTCGLKKLPLH